MNDMRKNVIICGLIAGGIVALQISLSTYYGSMCATDWTRGMIIGFASMIMAFSLIFVAIKNVRDKYQNGVISFGKAFMIGFYVSLICSTIYVITWEIIYRNFIPDFYEKYAEHIVESLKKQNLAPDEFQKQLAEVESNTKMYKSPVSGFLIIYMEILPVGILISLIAALILKRKNRVAVESA
jgi:hypothetical protein